MEKVDYNKKYFIVLVIFLNCFFCQCQQQKKLAFLSNKDTLSELELKSSIAILMKEDSLTIVNNEKVLILSVKIFNTISYQALKGEVYDSFEELFRAKYFDAAVEKLEAGLGPGSTIYSQKHDLYIDVGIEINRRSYYEIKKP